jgi:HSP20 family protein
MTLIRWNTGRDVTAWHPVTDLASEFVEMQKDIDRMFDRFRGGTLDEGASTGMLPAVDIVEGETDFLVDIEIPGVAREDVKITVQENVLTVKGEKKFRGERKGVRYRRVERAYGAFQRSFTLPSTVKADGIEATHADGILHIVLPKQEEAKPKEIEVKLK